jgi:hypothetical protein
MKKATVNIVRDLVKELVFVEEIIACEVLVNNQVKLTVCDTHGLVDNGLIIIGGQEVKVVDVIDGEFIIISGTSCPIETELTIPAPFYLHGTIKASSEELTLIKSNRERFQIVYLYEVLREKRNRDESINLGRRVELIMFFLTTPKNKGELTNDKYREYIDPMDNLAEDFVSLIQESGLIGDIEDEEYTIVPHSIAGFHDRLGHTKNFFNDNYSGIELRISLPINKEACIECKH